MTRHSAKKTTTAEPNRKGQSPSQIGQGHAARRLGVTREHLNRVLNGHRQSRRLMRLYRELMKEAA